MFFFKCCLTIIKFNKGFFVLCFYFVIQKSYIEPDQTVTPKNCGLNWIVKKVNCCISWFNVMLSVELMHYIMKLWKSWKLGKDLPFQFELCNTKVTCSNRIFAVLTVAEMEHFILGENSKDWSHFERIANTYLKQFFDLVCL